jgi:tetratricopeptide (TPR) repeat protein
MKPEEPQNPQSILIKIYGIAGVAFMALAGVVSSLGGFFTWISLAIASVFYFLTYQQLPAEEKSYESRERQSYQKAKPDIFTPSGNSSSSRNVIMMASAFVFGLLFLITMVAVFVTDPAIDNQSLIQRAETSRLSGEYDSAIYYYRQVVQSDEQNVDALLGYGNSLLGKENYDSAYFYYDKVLRVDPYNVYASYNKSLVRYNQQAYDKAVEEGWKTIDMAPEYYDAYALMGDSYYATKNYDSTLYYYTMAYEHDIRNAWICHVMGYLYDVRGETDKAITFYEEAVSYDSTKADVYQRLGELMPGEEGNYYRQKGLQMQ